MRGKIVWANQYKGYGEVESINGDSYYFSIPDFDLDKSQLKPGATVSFSVGSFEIFNRPAINTLKILDVKKRNRVRRNIEVSL